MEEQIDKDSNDSKNIYNSYYFVISSLDWSNHSVKECPCCSCNIIETNHHLDFTQIKLMSANKCESVAQVTVYNKNTDELDPSSCIESEARKPCLHLSNNISLLQEVVGSQLSDEINFVLKFGTGCLETIISSVLGLESIRYCIGFSSVLGSLLNNCNSDCNKFFIEMLEHLKHCQLCCRCAQFARTDIEEHVSVQTEEAWSTEESVWHNCSHDIRFLIPTKSHSSSQQLSSVQEVHLKSGLLGDTLISECFSDTVEDEDLRQVAGGATESWDKFIGLSDTHVECQKNVGHVIDIMEAAQKGDSLDTNGKLDFSIMRTVKGIHSQRDVVLDENSTQDFTCLRTIQNQEEAILDVTGTLKHVDCVSYTCGNNGLDVGRNIEICSYEEADTVTSERLSMRFMKDCKISVCETQEDSRSGSENMWKNKDINDMRITDPVVESVIRYVPPLKKVLKAVKLRAESLTESLGDDKVCEALVNKKRNAMHEGKESPYKNRDNSFTCEKLTDKITDFQQNGKRLKVKKKLASELILKESESLKNMEADYFDMLRFLRKNRKFNPERHFPWRQELVVFPLETAVGIDVYYFMYFEAFRLCSFIYSKFVSSLDIIVKQLAKAGFFYAGQGMDVLCFSCRCKFTVNHHETSVDDHRVDNLHISQCKRVDSNKPLEDWISNINLDQLNAYYVQHGSLLPFLLETENAGREVGNLEQLESPIEYSSGYGSDITSSVTNVATDIVSFAERQDSCGLHNIVTSAGKYRTPLYAPTRQFLPQNAASAVEEGAVSGTNQALDLGNASYPQFSSAESRKKTYTTWNPRHTHRSDDLALAGFFYAGYADCVRCFYCGLGLKFWRQADVPSYQHARFRPHCAFNRLYMGQDYINQVQQEILIEQRAAAPVANQNLSQQPGQAVVPAVVENRGRQNQGDHMNSTVVQEALRNGWPRDQVERAVNIIITDYGENCLEAELLTDVLTNFAIGNELQPNVPVRGTADATNPGHRNFTEQTSASVPLAADDTQEMESPAVPTSEAETAQAAARSVQHPPPPTLDPAELFQALEREQTLLNERVTCRVCRLRQVCCVYLPCGHVVACESCADNATHCLLCKKQIVGTANIFLA